MGSAAAEAWAALGDTTAAADITAQLAKVLAEADRRVRALDVCSYGAGKGWWSAVLADRWSLILEREHRFAEAAEVCRKGLALDPAHERMVKRLARCALKTGRA